MQTEGFLGCCGMDVVYLKGEIGLSPETKMKLVDYIECVDESGVGMSIILTEAQVVINKSWDSTKVIQDKKRLQSFLKSNGFRMVSSYLNGNSDNVLFLFVRTPDGDDSILYEYEEV